MGGTRRLARLVAFWGAIISAVMVVISGFTFLNPVSANGTLQGPVTVKTKDGAADLVAGDQDSEWTLRLPSGAGCPGDSANDEWRWQTYMVSDTINPATLVFDNTGPTPNNFGDHDTFKMPLITFDGNPVINQQTANAEPPSEIGVITTIPNFSFHAYGGDVPAGTYNIGVACTLGPPSNTQMSNYWNAQITVTTLTGSTFTFAPAASSGTTTTTIAGSTTTTPSTTTSTSTTSTTSTSTSTTSTTAPTTTSSTSTTSTTSTSTTSTSTTSTTRPITSTTSVPAQTTTTRAVVGTGNLARTGGVATASLIWGALLVAFGAVAIALDKREPLKHGIRR